MTHEDPDWSAALAEVDQLCSGQEIEPKREEGPTMAAYLTMMRQARALLGTPRQGPGASWSCESCVECLLPVATFERHFKKEESVWEWLHSQPWFNTTLLRVSLSFRSDEPVSRLLQMHYWHGGTFSSIIGFRNVTKGLGRDKDVEEALFHAFDAETPVLPDSEWALLAEYFGVREDWLRSPEPCSPDMRECWPEMKP